MQKNISDLDKRLVLKILIKEREVNYMSNKNKKITIARGVGYGLVDLMGGGAFTIIGAFLLFFYTTFAGLTPIEGASIIAIARIVDAIASLFIGSISDNFYKTKLGKIFGRRRFFLLIGAPLMAVYVLLWTTGRSYCVLSN